MYKKCILSIMGVLFFDADTYAKNQMTEIYFSPSTTLQSKKPNHQLNEFIKALKAGKKISHFFTPKVHFIYHEDNRSTGSTDGEIRNIDRKYLDQSFTIKVKTDGEGWEFNKEAVKTYLLKFNLLKTIKTWDRVEIAQYENTDTNTAYIHGKGELDYLVLHFNKKKQIYKIEFRSEDPG